MSLRVFPGETGISISRQRKEDRPSSNVGRHYPIGWGQGEQIQGRGKSNYPPSGARTPSALIYKNFRIWPSDSRTCTSSHSPIDLSPTLFHQGSQAFRLRVTPRTPPVLRSSGLHEVMLPAWWVLQPADSLSWDFSAFIIVSANSPNKFPLIFLYIYISIIYLSVYSLLFFWRILTYTATQQTEI